MFKTLQAAQQWIESVEKFSDKYDLSRMQNACAMLGHPENEFKSIHIGGTNGKGSTLQMLNQVLLESGYKTGTFTSPYIVHFNERITLNGTMISDADMLHYINEIYTVQKDYYEKYHDQITFFEMLTLISFLYFKNADVDVVLYEVGLGGTLDATNVITPLISIITSIGYDHMGVLGNSLSSIADNKLGIVKADVPLITGITQKSLYQQFNLRTNETGSKLYLVNEFPLTNKASVPYVTFIYNNETYTLGMQGEHQINNALTVIQAAHILNVQQGFTIDDNAVKRGLRNARMPGRFEHVKPGLIMDGAHNVLGMEASLKTLKNLYPDQRCRIVFAVMEDKDYKAMLSQIEAIADEVILSEIPYGRSAKVETLSDYVSYTNKKLMPDLETLENHLLYVPYEGITLVTGSFYFISMIRSKFSPSN